MAAFIRFPFWITKTGKRFQLFQSALILYYCLRDVRTPARVRWILSAALLYVMLPFDFMPDMLGWLGWTDDALIIAAAARIASSWIRPEHRKKAARIWPL